MRLAALRKWFFVAASVLGLSALVIALALPAPALFGQSFDLLSNVFFLVAFVFIVQHRAFVLGAVVWLTYTVSVVHHGCLVQLPLRQFYRVWTAFLVTSGVCVAAALTFLHAKSHLTRPHARLRLLLPLGAVVLAVLVLFILIASASPERVDGCLFVYAAGTHVATGHALQAVYETADMITATAAIIAATLYFLHVDARLTGLMFWLLNVINLIAQLMLNARLVSALTAYLVLGGFALAALLAYAVAASALQKNTNYEHYKNGEILVALVFIVSAFVVYGFVNQPGWHGLWHLLGSEALVFIVDATGQAIERKTIAAQAKWLYE